MLRFACLLWVLVYSSLCSCNSAKQNSFELHPWLASELPIAIPLQIVDLLVEQTKQPTQQPIILEVKMAPLDPGSNGMHVNLQISIELRGGKLPIHKTTNLLVLFNLPSGCYVDIDEVVHRHVGFNWTEGMTLYSVAPNTNPDLFTQQATAEIIGVTFHSVPWSALSHFVFTFPVHLRYHAARTVQPGSDASQAYDLVLIPSPLAFICLEKCTISSKSSRIPIQLITNDGISANQQLSASFHLASLGGGADVSVGVPVGSLGDIKHVQTVTLTTLLLTVALLLLSLYYV